MKDTEAERCVLEEVTLNHGTRQYVLIPEIIFQTDDIILAASGSFSCVRALYRTAARSRALERFYYEIITPEQYAAGLAEHRIAKLIEKAILSTNAGGCDGCISGTGKEKEEYLVTKSRVDDLDVARGCEEKITNGIIWDYQQKGSQGLLCITGAGLPKLISFDYDRVLKEIQAKGIVCIRFSSDGFHFAGQGISEMYLALLKQLVHFQNGSLFSREEKQQIVGILGGNCFATLQNEEIQESIEQIKKVGFTVVWPEKEAIENMADLTKTQCNWVVSSEGIEAAKWLEKNYEIPYMIGVPINKKMVSAWRAFLVDGKSECLNPMEIPTKKFKIDNLPYSKGNILLIGDPVIIGSIGSYLSCISYANVTYAVYAQLPSVKRWYKTTLRNTESHWIGQWNFIENIHYFKEKEELASLIADADIIFGELLFKMAFAERELFHKKWVDLPMPILNCGIRNDKSQYFLFGAKGVRWINGSIDIRK